MNALENILKEKYPEEEIQLLDLKELDIQFSDGRNYMDYSGDTGFAAKTIMDSDILLIGSPIFQASIPASLKNIFDLMPQNAFRNKTIGLVITAGSPKHFLVAENQLKPILHYMKANLVPNYVFIEDTDFYRNEIVNDDTLFRLDKLAEDTIILARTYQEMWKKQEDTYDF